MSGAVGKRHRRDDPIGFLGVRGQERIDRTKRDNRSNRSIHAGYSYRYGYRYQYMRESGIDWESSIREERMNEVRAARGKVYARKMRDD